MRNWHYFIIHKLCPKHFNANWNEGLTCYWAIACEKVIVNGREYRAICTGCGIRNAGNTHCQACGKRMDGYLNHTAVSEYKNCPQALWLKLAFIRLLRLKRGLKARPLPRLAWRWGLPKTWQTLGEQRALLQDKGCQCRV